MSLNGFTGITPCIRLPRPLNDALLSMSTAPRYPHWQGPTDEAYDLDKTVEWGIVRRGVADRNGEKTPVFVLTDFGLAVQSLASTKARAKNQHTPLVPFPHFFNLLPQDIREWLQGGHDSTPISAIPPGRFFEALGVLAPHQGDYVLTSFGRAAVAFAETVGTATDYDGSNHVMTAVYPPHVRALLGRLLMAPGGISVLSERIDGREIKALSENYADIIRIRDGHYRLNPAMQTLANILANNDVTHIYDVFMAFSEADRDWFLTEFGKPPTSQRDSVFSKLGWVFIRSRSSGTTRFTKMGKIIRDKLLGMLNGSVPIGNNGADLIAPEPEDDEFDLLGGTPLNAEAPGDPFDILGGSAAPELEPFDIL